MTALRMIKIALALTIAAFTTAGIYISFAIVERQEYLREVSRYNVVWAVSQALAEFQRLEYRIAAFGLQEGGVSKDEVLLRFDIMHNRVNILRGGDVAAFTAHDPDRKAVVDDLAATLAAIEPLLERLEEPGMVKRILTQLSPLERRLTEMAGAVNQFGGSQVAEDQRVLLELHWTFSAIASGLVLCGFAFIGLLFFQNRLIHQAHDELRSMTGDLHAAKDAAEAASEAKSRFLANMSHELRTPLNAIIGFSEIIVRESFGPVGNPKYAEYVAAILKSGRHMSDLIGDILTMAKLDAGRFELVMEPVDLRSLVEGTLTMFQGTEMAQNRDVAIEPGGDWPELHADERVVRQMMLNLLSNAVKFSEEGTPVRITSQLQQGELHVTVADRGIGMTSEQIKIAVQPFQQVDNRLARKYDGTGLGLSIVKAMMERHGGRLMIDSRPAVGTRVTLIFPGTLIGTSTLARVA